MPPWIERPALDFDLDADWDTITLPAGAIASARRLLDAILGEIPSSARFLAYLVRLRTWGRFQKELGAMARRAGTDWRDIMLANLSYDLVLGRLGCSTLALATRDGPVLARNMDWWPEDLLARASYLLRYRQQGRPRFASAAWPGGVGVVTGMSERGFALALNAAISPEGVARTGYPMLLFLRTVLEDARDFDHALKMCVHQRLTAPGLITLVGHANDQRVVVERTPKRSALRGPDAPGAPLIATNHFRVLFPPSDGQGLELNETTCGRFDFLCRRLGDDTGHRALADEELLYTLSEPDVIQSITAQHVLIRPAEAKMRLFVPRRLL
ncbi:MAG: C45 family peptidase [Gemmataceae bacterium]